MLESKVSFIFLFVAARLSQKAMEHVSFYYRWLERQ
jgi:hypothetical protein